MENKSEVARLRERIALEYQACQRVFTDFTPTAKHAYITRRQENIAQCYSDLQKHLSPQDALTVLIETERQTTSTVPSGDSS